jgi:hypothetical protein
VSYWCGSGSGSKREKRGRKTQPKTKVKEKRHIGTNGAMQKQWSRKKGGTEAQKRRRGVPCTQSNGRKDPMIGVGWTMAI